MCLRRDSMFAHLLPKKKQKINARTTRARCSLAGKILLFELVVRKLFVMSRKTCSVVCFCAPQNIVKCKIAGVNNSLKPGTCWRGHLQVNKLMQCQSSTARILYYALLCEFGAAGVARAACFIFRGFCLITLGRGLNMSKQ